MRISYWSSDVCSSDLPGGLDFGQFGHRASVADGCGPRYGKRRLADARGAARTNVNGQSDAPPRMNAAAPYPPAGMAFDRARPHHAWTRSPDPAYPMPASTLDFLAGGLLQFRSEEHTSELPSLMRNSYAA